MKNKLKLGILAIAIICLVTGSYAVYLGNNRINDITADIPSDNYENTIKHMTMNKDNNIPNPEKSLNPDAQNNPVKTLKKIPGTNIQVNATKDYTDLYIQCVCGGYIALGEVTKPLPEGAICPDGCGGYGIFDDGRIYTYEEVYALWELYGDRYPDNDDESVDDLNPPQNNHEPNVSPEVNQPHNDGESVKPTYQIITTPCY